MSGIEELEKAFNQMEYRHNRGYRPKNKVRVVETGKKCAWKYVEFLFGHRGGFKSTCGHTGFDFTSTWKYCPHCGLPIQEER